MARKRVAKVRWQLNLTLYPGVHDDLIALKDATPAGQHAQVVIDALRHGYQAAPATDTDEQLEDLLTNLL